MISIMQCPPTLSGLFEQLPPDDGDQGLPVSANIHVTHQMCHNVPANERLLCWLLTNQRPWPGVPLPPGPGLAHDGGQSGQVGRQHQTDETGHLDTSSHQGAEVLIAGCGLRKYFGMSSCSRLCWITQSTSNWISRKTILSRFDELHELSLKSQMPVNPSLEIQCLRWASLLVKLPVILSAFSNCYS